MGLRLLKVTSKKLCKPAEGSFFWQEFRILGVIGPSIDEIFWLFGRHTRPSVWQDGLASDTITTMALMDLDMMLWVSQYWHLAFMLASKGYVW